MKYNIGDEVVFLEDDTGFSFNKGLIYEIRENFENGISYIISYGEKCTEAFIENRIVGLLSKKECLFELAIGSMTEKQRRKKASKEYIKAKKEYDVFLKSKLKEFLIEKSILADSKEIKQREKYRLQADYSIKNSNNH